MRMPTHKRMHTNTNPQPRFLCVLHNCEWELFLLSANVIVNHGFIVAATAQSLQRQNKAFIAFVHSPLPVKNVPFSCFYLHLLFLPLFVPAFDRNRFLEKCLRCLPAMEHLSLS